MATPTPRSKAGPGIPRHKTRHPQSDSASSDPFQVVDPGWLIKAIVITIAGALICGYLTLCLLFYQGQWQLVLHPSRATPAPSSIAGAPFQTVHFGVDETATPQLTGWFIPAVERARYGSYTILYLPSGDGSLADWVPQLSALHELGINVFAFDYRGYGQSAPTRPNQKRMTDDAASAWQYLTVSRAIRPSQIVVFGDALGDALAAKLAAEHPEMPAAILESPRPMVIENVLADPRTKWLPVHILFHENFDLTRLVATLKTPKLLLINSGVKSSNATAMELEQLTLTAASPKRISTLPFGDFNGPLYREQLASFLDQYLH